MRSFESTVDGELERIRSERRDDPLAMPINPSDLELLATTRTIELTTIGRRSGKPSRIEIWWFYFEDGFIITGTPGSRDWLANVRSDPAVIVHANDASYPGRATVVGDRALRRRFFESSSAEVRWYGSQADLDRLIEAAPMIEILFD